MLSLSSLIEFLLDMLRDEHTQADFARDPSATLAARGLSDVTAQDVRDVQPMLADVGGVHRVVHPDGDHAARHVVGHGGSGWHAPAHGSGAHEVVREIHHVAHDYTVARPVTHVTQEYKTYNSFTEFRTTDNSVHASDGSTVIQDSYNQDNDMVDNKGGTIDGSTIGGGDVAGSNNEVDSTTVDGSGNDSHAVTADQDWDDVGNDGGDHDHPDPEEHDGGDDTGGDQPSITYGEPYGSGGGSDPGDVNGSYSGHTPAPEADADAPELVGAEHS